MVKVKILDQPTHRVCCKEWYLLVVPFVAFMSCSKVLPKKTTSIILDFNVTSFKLRLTIRAKLVPLT